MSRRRVELATDIGKMEINCGFGAIQYMRDIPRAFSRRTPLYTFKFARGERDRWYDRRLPYELHGSFANKVAE